MYVDGASEKTGSDTGILLLGLDDQKITYALQFTFASPNNEVEYAALARSLQIQVVQVYNG